jgi:RNA polymerase sigma factor (sigma-70 family)
MHDDTDLGGPAAAFPLTRGSLVRAAGSDDPSVRRRAFSDLVEAYWKPVYKYLRLKRALANEDAKDLTQAFFARALEKGFFDRFDPARARFRTFLRVCLDRFAASEYRAETSQRRGGDAVTLSLDFEAADGELRRLALSDKTDLDEFFRQEWVRGLFELAVDDLRRHCAAEGKEVHFALFERYDIDGPETAERVTYAQLGQQFGIPETQVTNYLAIVRRQFRQCFLDRLRATTSSDDEYADESRRLFGGDLR